jgi:hypothetical protein
MIKNYLIRKGIEKNLKSGGATSQVSEMVGIRNVSFLKGDWVMGQKELQWRVQKVQVQRSFPKLTCSVTQR